MKFNHPTAWSWETDELSNGSVYYIEKSDTKPIRYTAWRNNKGSHLKVGRNKQMTTLLQAKNACERDHIGAKE